MGKNKDEDIEKIKDSNLTSCIMYHALFSSPVKFTQIHPKHWGDVIHNWPIAVQNKWTTTMLNAL